MLQVVIELLHKQVIRRIDIIRASAALKERERERERERETEDETIDRSDG